MKKVVEIASEQKADIVGLSPLHAMFLDRPEDASPYSPSDRLLLNVLNIDIESISEFDESEAAQKLYHSGDFQAKLAAARASETVDYSAVAELTLPILRLLHEEFEAKPGNAHTQLANFLVERRGTNMRHAGALRIDHVMALRRLYWIPQDGTPEQGAYVDYPIDDLVGLIALESQRNRCLVINEDLGGVPDGFRERMAEANILSYRVLSFEQEEGEFHAPEDHPYLALSVAGNHDLPTLPGWWRGEDIELRKELGLLGDRADAGKAWRARAKEREALLAAFMEHGLIESLDIAEAEFCTAAHRFLGQTASLLTLVQLDDLTKEVAQVNAPGTSIENPNWRRKLSLAIDDPEFTRRLSTLQSLMRRVEVQQPQNA